MEASLQPASGGWHCSHLYYSFDRAVLNEFDPEELEAGRAAIQAALDPESDTAPTRLQTSIVSGQKADFGLMILDPDPLKIDAVDQQLRSGPIGTALVPAYSFISLTEVSEYVPTLEQYGARLAEEGDQLT